GPGRRRPPVLPLPLRRDTHPRLARAPPARPGRPRRPPRRAPHRSPRHDAARPRKSLAAGARAMSRTGARRLAWGLWWIAVALLIAAFFLFPDGRLPTRRWMPILIFVVVAAALRFVLAAGASWTLDGHPNAYAAEPPYGEVLQVIAIVFSRLSVVIALLALLSLIVRYRRSPQHERQQIKWVAVGTAVATATLLAYLGLGGWAWAATLGPAETPIVAVYAAGLLALPVSLAIAMLRY